jgi:hypothetical protein
MKISLELPPGVALPTLNGTLVGELDDLHIQIRFKDLVDTLKSSVENGAGVHVSHNGQHIDVPARPAQVAAKKAATKLPKPVKAVDLVAPPDAEARAIGAGDLVGTIPGTAAHEVMTALAKKSPLSSLEILRLLEPKKFTAGSVYQATAKLKDRGKIESFVDSADGTRRWKLCQQQ